MKKIVCLSASNVITARNNSASTRTCSLVKGFIEGECSNKQVRVEVLELINYQLQPCTMCEKCLPGNQCHQDQDFNQLYEKLVDADGIIIVTPHYALLPAKLVILLEKLEEMFFLNYCKDANYKFSLSGKVAGIIGHGGMIENYQSLYNENLIIPLKNALAALGLEVVKIDDNYGVSFGVNGYKKKDDTITPGMDHDWEQIKSIIAPLLEQLVLHIS